jgi:peptidoglycan/xylan/chitin deacetylase (PgdA/CDA1 family)
VPISQSPEHRRRRRGLAAVLALIVVAIVLVVVLTAGGGKTVSSRSGSGNRSRRRHGGGEGGGGKGAGGKQGKGSETKSKGSAKLVRNATPQPSWKPDTGPVPILVYHALGEAPPTEEYPGLYVSEPEFEEEMAWLHSEGWEAVTLDQVEDAWYHGGTLPKKPIVITFDNGYPTQVTFAPEVLAKYGWPGVLFEITEEHLRPFEITPVIEMGWEVDSHSATHPDLTELSGKELEYQVAASRRYLKRKFGIPSNNFCYPSSEYNAATIASVKEAGYVGAVTENAGYATREEPYELDRYEIEGGDGVSGLSADLSSGG